MLLRPGGRWAFGSLSFVAGLAFDVGRLAWTARAPRGCLRIGTRRESIHGGSAAASMPPTVPIRRYPQGADRFLRAVGGAKAKATSKSKSE